MECENPLELSGAILSMLTFVCDIVTDVLVAAFYFHHEHYNWAALTLTLIIIPGWIVSFFSWCWQKEDSDRKVTWKLILIHVFCLSPLWRYYHTLIALVSQKPGPVGSYSESLRDVSMLRLIEGVCEATPQLILQLYIVLKGTKQTDIVALISCFFSLISVSWGVASYTRALRKAYHDEMSRASVFVNFAWRSYEFISRVTLLVMLAYTHGFYVLVPIAIRWFLSLIWISFHGTAFHSESTFAEGLFRLIMAFLNVFMFFNTTDGPTKFHAFLYYLVTLIELLVILAFTMDTIIAEFNAIPIWICLICYACALIMMSIYYGVFHPSKQQQHQAAAELPKVDKIEIIEQYHPLPRFTHLER